MTDDINDLRTTVLLSMQRALWGLVTPDLRGVAVSWSPAQVGARFLYDVPLKDLHSELVDDADSEVLSDLPDHIVTSFRAEYLPADKLRTLNDGEWWVYLRREATDE